jgi:hypothetical protein
VSINKCHIDLEATNIGKSFANNELLIYSDKMYLIEKAGVVGELYIAGDSVAIYQYIATQS